MVRVGETGVLLELRARGKQDARARSEDRMVLGTHDFDRMRMFAGDPKWGLAHVIRAPRANSLPQQAIEKDGEPVCSARRALDRRDGQPDLSEFPLKNRSHPLAGKAEL